VGASRVLGLKYTFDIISLGFRVRVLGFYGFQGLGLGYSSVVGFRAALCIWLHVYIPPAQGTLSIV